MSDKRLQHIFVNRGRQAVKPSTARRRSSTTTLNLTYNSIGSNKSAETSSKEGEDECKTHKCSKIELQVVQENHQAENTEPDRVLCDSIDQQKCATASAVVDSVGEHTEPTVLTVGEHTEPTVLTVGEHTEPTVLTVGEHTEPTVLTVGEHTEPTVLTVEEQKNKQSENSQTKDSKTVDNKQYEGREKSKMKELKTECSVEDKDCEEGKESQPECQSTLKEADEGESETKFDERDAESGQDGPALKSDEINVAPEKTKCLEKGGEDERPNKELESKEPTKKKEELTPEQVAEKFEAGIELCKAKCELLKSIQSRHFDQVGQPFTQDFYHCVVMFAESYYFFSGNNISLEEVMRYRSTVGDLLCQDHVLKMLLDALTDSFKRMDFFTVDGAVVKEFWLPVKNILNTLLSYSDFVKEVKLGIVQHGDCLHYLLQVLQSYYDAHVRRTLKVEQEKLLKWCLCIVHNCGSAEENIQKMREHDPIPVLLSYLESHEATMRLGSITTLADLTNESEAELLRARPDIFSFVLKKLQRALKKVNRRDIGWSVEELTRALCHLARNDGNKEILVETGCLPLLLKTIQTGNPAELEEALECLWNLSFDATNKPKILAEPGLMQAVGDKYPNVEGAAKHACQGILWSMRGVMLSRTGLRKIAKEILVKADLSPRKETQPVSIRKNSLVQKMQSKGHVMISYQWANQEVIKRICEELRAKDIPVWIDIDYMGGSTLQAMAQAVEESFAVIIAMSQKYKDSPNTRAEAEYTYQQRKPIIPLIMQEGYRPDGWLGLILGSKLFYDFSGKYSFDTRISGLIKAVFALFKKGPDNKAILNRDERITCINQSMTIFHSPPAEDVPEGASMSTPPSADSERVEKSLIPTPGQRSEHPRTTPQIDVQKILGWGDEDVHRWVAKHKLEGSALQSLSGKEIIFMHRLRYEAPEFFYQCLEKRLNLSSLLEFAKALEAFEDLSS